MTKQKCNITDCPKDISHELLIKKFPQQLGEWDIPVFHCQYHTTMIESFLNVISKEGQAFVLSTPLIALFRFHAEEQSEQMRENNTTGAFNIILKKLAQFLSDTVEYDSSENEEVSSLQ